MDQTALLAILRKYWGYGSFRPLQSEAMSNVLTGRDTVVVVPTGGGKSLCYQVPAVALPGTAVVISPLLSLMKDQTDALHQCGVHSGCINSMQSSKEQADVLKRVRAGGLKLLYVAPERLASSGFLDLLREITPSFFAIDEAHCISSWGHEFRPDYLKLSMLKQLFPQSAIIALTATATEKVRADIVRQLRLRNPEILVGQFDRPNLTYRVGRRVDEWSQIREVINRHRGESGIIYCISKRRVDDLSAALREAGYKALPYHAGMEKAERRHNQEAFIRDETDIIVATVAFGMGIDKSNVRFVLHAQAPKTIENYQQEAGRAGRDGLPSECILLWTKGDFGLWRRIISELDEEPRRVAEAKLSQLSRFCEDSVCRHKALVQYFGQPFEKGNCGACDHCLGENLPKKTVQVIGQRVTVRDPLIIAQKILSCVARLGESFPIGYIGRVLVGSKDRRIAEYGHDTLSTYGILRSESRGDVRDWMTQLAEQECLALTSNGHVSHVTEKGWQVLRGTLTPSLERTEGPSDPRLVEELRLLRRRIADELNIAAIVVFSDAVLHELAARRPSTMAAFRQVSGVGENKAMQFGRRFVECIVRWCDKYGVEPNVALKLHRRAVATLTDSPSANFVEQRAYEMFRRGASVDDVVVALRRARSTVVGYLTTYIRKNGTEDSAPWVEAATASRILRAAEIVGTEQLRPIFEYLGEKISYEEIRIVLACLRNAQDRELPVAVERRCA
jgi:ATP-dependent DNA helicase RecQ